MNGRKLRKPELLLFLLPLLLPILYFGASAVRKHFQYEVKSDVGQFPTERAEQQAIVKRLSDLLKEYPNATEFTIYGNYPSLRRGGTAIYIRHQERKPRIWHSEKFGDNELRLNEHSNGRAGGYTRGLGNILDEDIHVIAKNSGDLNDVYSRAEDRMEHMTRGWKREAKALGIKDDWSIRWDDTPTSK